MNPIIVPILPLLQNNSHFMKKVLSFLFLSLNLFVAIGQDAPCITAIQSNFNGTEIDPGRYIWFNSHFNIGSPNSCSGSPLTIHITQGRVSSSDPDFPYVLFVPDANITFSPTATSESSNFDAATNTWNTVIPCSEIKNSEIFSSGFIFSVPSTLRGIQNITWRFRATYTSPNPVSELSFNWKWSAAVYTSMPTDYNDLDVVLLHSSLHAGTPNAYKDYVIGGARGGGGSNFTGSWSGTGSCDNIALPVTFLSFVAERTHQKVNLKWQTSSEQNNRGFYVQQLINNQWRDLSFVASKAVNGNSTSVLTYEYKDVNIERQASQYRIRQVDFDNQYSVSEIRTVNGIDPVSNQNLLIFPNPSANRKVTLLFSGASIRDILIYDITGRAIRQYLNVSENNLLVNDLNRGSYLIKVVNKKTGKEVIEKFSAY